MVEFKSIEEEYWALTEEGESIRQHGSHEVKVFNLIPEEEEGGEGIPVSLIKVQSLDYY